MCVCVCVCVYVCVCVCVVGLAGLGTIGAVDKKGDAGNIAGIGTSIQREYYGTTSPLVVPSVNFFRPIKH